MNWFKRVQGFFTKHKQNREVCPVCGRLIVQHANGKLHRHNCLPAEQTAGSIIMDEGMSDMLAEKRASVYLGAETKASADGNAVDVMDFRAQVADYKSQKARE